MARITVIEFYFPCTPCYLQDSASFVRVVSPTFRSAVLHIVCCSVAQNLTSLQLILFQTPTQQWFQNSARNVTVTSSSFLYYKDNNSLPATLKGTKAGSVTLIKSPQLTSHKTSAVHFQRGTNKFSYYDFMRRKLKLADLTLGLLQQTWIWWNYSLCIVRHA